MSRWISVGVDDHEARLAAHVGLQVLDQRVVERVGHGDGHRAIVGGDDERPVPAREGARQELRRELGVDLERVEIDERDAEVLRERLHDDALGERVSLVARLPEAHRHDHLGRVNALADARPSLARPGRALAEQARVRDLAARDGLAPLLVRDEARALEDAAQVVERERRAGVERRAGHESGAYHGWGRGRRRLRPAGAGVLRPRAPVAATRGPPAPWQARRPAAARYPGEPYVEPPHGS